MNLVKTSKNTLKITIKTAIGLILVLILYVLGMKGFQFGEAIFSEAGVTESPGVEVVIKIEEQDSLMDVAEKAVKVGLAKDKTIFYLQSLIYEAKFLPYEYTVNNSLPPEEIIEILCKKPEEEVTE